MSLMDRDTRITAVQDFLDALFDRLESLPLATRCDCIAMVAITFVLFRVQFP